MSLTACEKEVFARILKEELVPATGCTEPIAIAYAAAVAKGRWEKLPTAARLK